MSYEYSSEGQQLSDLNPYRIENMLLAARAAVLLVGGLLLLVLARKHLVAQAWGASAARCCAGTWPCICRPPARCAA